MSIHAIPADADLALLRTLIAEGLRPYSGLVVGKDTSGRPTAVEFDPDLSAEETAIYTGLVRLAQETQADKAAIHNLSAVLDQIAVWQARIAQGKAAVNEATTVGTVKPVLEGILDLQDDMLSLLALVTKVLGRQA